MSDEPLIVITPPTVRLDAEGFYARITLGETEIGLVPLTDGRTRVTIGPPSDWQTWREGW